MANHGVVIANKIAAKDIDAYVRPVVSACSVDNGYVFSLPTQMTSSGSGEVWNVVTPTTGSITELWMAFESPLPSAFSGTKQYRGLGTVQDFYNVAGQVFTAIKPRIGDIITVSADVISNGSSTGNFVVAAVETLQMAFAAAQTAATGLAFRYLGTTYMSIPDGSISNQRVVAHKLECIAV